MEHAQDLKSLQDTHEYRNTLVVVHIWIEVVDADSIYLHLYQQTEQYHGFERLRQVSAST
jgi:hypothetical protein